MTSHFTGDWAEDSERFYTILEGVDFFKNGRTGGIMRGSQFRDARSMLWGASWRYPCREYPRIEGTNLYHTKCRARNPHLEGIFNEFLKLHFNSFPYTQVQLNKNFVIPKHKDPTNVGESILVGFGKYTGGEINIEYEDEEGLEPITKTYDIRRNGGVIFNGALHQHYVSPFELPDGTNRYSLVFFKSMYNKKTKK